MTRKNLKGLFSAHKREIQAYLTHSLQDAELAADLTQETFLRYAEQGDGTATVLSDRSYLFRMARNLAIDHIRRRVRQRTDLVHEERLAALPEDRPTPEAMAAAREKLRLLQEIVLELPERTQRIFVLVRIDGLTYAQAASRLGISESSVQKHLADAVQHVMLRLKRGGAE